VIRTQALVARSVDYGESDKIVTLITESAGKLGALVRGGRKSQKRAGGALEPFQTIQVELEERRGDLAFLKDARVVRMRANIMTSLDAMEAAGVAMRWARHLFPAKTREPEGFAILMELLDRLDGGATPGAELASAGLRLLAAVGYALDLERCVSCGKPCPPGKPSGIDASRGGLVCRSCGGAARVIDADTRAVAIALQSGERPNVSDAQAKEILAIVSDAMAVHAGFEP
jgi:DNA repair protein RecO (recombination protein O)